MHMKTLVKGVNYAQGICFEYAVSKSRRTEIGEQPYSNREREKIKEMLVPVVKDMVQKQLKEQQEYYKARPSQAAKHIQQFFGAGNIEKTLAPTVSVWVYEQIEERLRFEWVRKGR